MKINFTKNEYRILLDMVYLGQWMVEAHKTGDLGNDDAHEKLVQKIYAFSKEMGCADLVMPKKGSNKFYPSRSYEEESGTQDIIDQYNDDTFWDELVSRLSERDARADAEAKNQKISSIEVFWKLSEPHESKYADEFSKNGLKNLIISET